MKPKLGTERLLIQGMALALSEMQARLDQPSLVGSVLRDAGLRTERQLRDAGVDPLDIRRLRTSLREARRRRGGKP